VTVIADRVIYFVAPFDRRETKDLADTGGSVGAQKRIAEAVEAITVARLNSHEGRKSSRCDSAGISRRKRIFTKAALPLERLRQFRPGDFVRCDWPPRKGKVFKGLM